MPANIQTDSSSQRYVEIVMLNDQKVRITHVPNGWTDGEVVRIQIRDNNGHLRQGPDIPIENLGEVLQAMVELIRR